MNGLLEYEYKYINKINNIINDNTELQGFYYYISNNVSISTSYNYLNNVNTFMKIIDKKSINELKAIDFINYLSKYNLFSNKRKYSSSYLITIYQSLKKFSEYLILYSIISPDEIKIFQRPKFKETQETIEKRENGYLTKNEIKIYLDNIEKMSNLQWKERDMSIILIFINTGIRVSALYKLDVNNIDLNNNSIIVTDKEQKVKRKTLTNKTMYWLKEWLIRRELLLGDQKEEALFISNRKKRISIHAISNIVNKYSVKINNKNITPHKLRATYGTYLYDKTKDIYFVQKCLDHASPKTSELYIRGQKNLIEEKSKNIVDELFD